MNLKLLLKNKVLKVNKKRKVHLCRDRDRNKITEVYLKEKEQFSSLEAWMLELRRRVSSEAGRMDGSDGSVCERP